MFYFMSCINHPISVGIAVAFAMHINGMSSNGTKKVEYRNDHDAVTSRYSLMEQHALG
jgi:hypothetical protein